MVTSISGIWIRRIEMGFGVVAFDSKVSSILRLALGVIFGFERGGGKRMGLVQGGSWMVLGAGFWSV